VLPTTYTNGNGNSRVVVYMGVGDLVVHASYRLAQNNVNESLTSPEYHAKQKNTSDTRREQQACNHMSMVADNVHLLPYH